MSKFDKVRHYYQSGYWNIERVKNAVKKQWITAEQYKEITGEEYEP